MKKIMKRAIFMCALVAVAAISCTNDLEENTSAGGAKHIEFSAEIQTRTALAENEAGYAVNWLATDEVTIFANEASAKYSVVPYSDPSVCNFTSDAPLVWDEATAYTYTSVYPYVDAADPAAATITLAQAQRQSAAGDHGHVGDYMAMKAESVARAAGDDQPVSLRYHNIYSVLKLTLTSAEAKHITHVTLEATDAPLAIKSATIDLTSAIGEGYSQIPVTVGEGLNSVDLFIAEPAALSADGVTVFVVVATGTHASESITLTAHSLDNCKATTKISGGITFNSGKCYRKSIALPAFEQKAAAAIEHISSAASSDAYQDVVTFADGAEVISNRAGYALVNVPEAFTSYHVATIGSGAAPAKNSIKALNAGYIYTLVGIGAVDTQTRINTLAKLDTAMRADGWTNTTVIPQLGEGTPETATYTQILYTSNKTHGCFILYERLCDEGEVVDLTPYNDLVGWCSIRPVAPSITTAYASHAAVELVPVDFNTGYYYSPVNFEHSATIISNRTTNNGNSVDVFIYNIPEKYRYSADTPWKTLVAQSGKYPNYKVKVLSDGMVYLLFNNASDSAVRDNAAAEGWNPVTVNTFSAMTAEQKTAFAAQEWDDTYNIYSTKQALGEEPANNMGYWAIYAKEHQTGDEIELKSLATTLCGKSNDFNAVRVVAQELTMPLAELSIDGAANTGELRQFKSGVKLSSNNKASTIGSQTNDATPVVKALNDGFIGLDFFATPRVSDYNQISATVTKSGMVYMMAHNKGNATATADGWTYVDKFYLSDFKTTNHFCVYAKWAEAGDTVVTTDFTDVSMSSFHTGILMAKDIVVTE